MESLVEFGPKGGTISLLPVVQGSFKFWLQISTNNSYYLWLLEVWSVPVKKQKYSDWLKIPALYVMEGQPN